MQFSRSERANYFANYTDEREHLRARYGSNGSAVVIIEKLKTIITAARFRGSVLMHEP